MEPVSIVMTMKNRSELLERSLMALTRWQQYSSGKVELVIVDDTSDDYENLAKVLRQYIPFFSEIRLVTMDKRLSKIPVAFNNPALGINIAVKHATHEIIYKTDPECLPLTETVLKAAELFDPTRLWFFSVRMLTAEENTFFEMDDLLLDHPFDIYKQQVHEMPNDALWHISEHNRNLPYWFGAVFSRRKFMEIGGLDERFLSGFAGEDDDWANRMKLAGARWSWSDELRILHLYHGSENRRWHHSPAHWHNINLLKENVDRNLMVANQGHDWGADTAVVKVERIL